MNSENFKELRFEYVEKTGLVLIFCSLAVYECRFKT